MLQSNLSSSYHQSISHAPSEDGPSLRKLCSMPSKFLLSSAQALKGGEKLEKLAGKAFLLDLLKKPSPALKDKQFP